MIFLQIAGCALFFAGLLPLVIYFSVKLGRYGYLQASEIFRKNHSDLSSNP